MTAKDFSITKSNIEIEGLRTDGETDFVHIGLKEVAIDTNYLPIDDPKDDYMNDKQMAFFKKVLLNWRQDLCEKTQETMSTLSEDSDERRVSEEGDFVAEEERLLTELRTRDRYRKLIHKIEDALIRIEIGEYGYCEESGEEIGIPRLMIRPIATLAIAQQEGHEKAENTKEESEYSHQLLINDDSLLDPMPS
jgi:DnaK suppressor protein